MHGLASRLATRRLRDPSCLKTSVIGETEKLLPSLAYPDVFSLQRLIQQQAHAQYTHILTHVTYIYIYRYVHIVYAWRPIGPCPCGWHRKPL